MSTTNHCIDCGEKANVLVKGRCLYCRDDHKAAHPEEYEPNDGAALFSWGDKPRDPDWGGKRHGAGRKGFLVKPEKISIRLEARQLAALKHHCKKERRKRNAVIRDAIDAYLKGAGNEHETTK